MINKFLVLVLYLLSSLNPVLAAPSDPSIRIGYDDFCPYTCLRADEKGYVVDVVDEILKSTGFKVDHIKGSWARLRMLAQKGDLEIVFLTRYEAEELKIDRNASPLGHVEGQLFTHKGNPWQYKSASSLKGLRMAIIRDYGYPSAITDLLEDPEQSKNVLVLSSDQGTDLQLKMLVKQRVAIIPSDRNVFLYHARRMGLESQIQMAGDLPMDAQYTAMHVGIASRNPNLRKKLREALDHGIENLRKNGRIDVIKARYKLN